MIILILSSCGKFTIKTEVNNTSNNSFQTTNTEKITFGFNVGEKCYSRNINLIDNNAKDTGEVFSLAKNKVKVSVINLWGYWCTPCKEELPGFINVYNDITAKYGDVIEMVAIHQGTTFLKDDDYEQVSDYIKDQNASIKWGYDDASDSYFKMLGGTSIYPITIVVDGDGIVRLNRVGKLSESELLKVVEDILSNK